MSIYFIHLFTSIVIWRINFILRLSIHARCRLWAINGQSFTTVFVYRQTRNKVASWPRGDPMASRPTHTDKLLGIQHRYFRVVTCVLMDSVRPAPQRHCCPVSTLKYSRSVHRRGNGQCANCHRAGFDLFCGNIIDHHSH